MGHLAGVSEAPTYAATALARQQVTSSTMSTFKPARALSHDCALALHV
jgi:hypothetical protein